MLTGLARHDVHFVAVSSFGRSGSTYLMALLRAAGVRVAGAIPFEDRMLQLGFIHALATAMNATLPPGARQTHCLGGDYHSASYDGVTDSAGCAARLNTALSALRGGWLAEKMIGMNLLRVMRGFDDAGRVRPIYLLRDPRDVFLSIKAFNRKRGANATNSFGDAGDDAGTLERICSFQRVQIADHRRTGGLLLRYEDLIARRESSFAVLLRYLGRQNLGAGLLAERIPQTGAAVQQHMTSPTAEASVGRWQRDDGAPYRELFAAADSAVKAAGYPG